MDRERKVWKVCYRCHDADNSLEWRQIKDAYMAGDTAEEAAEKVLTLMKVMKPEIIGVPEWTGEMTDAGI